MFKKIFLALLLVISLIAGALYYYRDRIFLSNNTTNTHIALPTVVGATDLGADKEEWLASMVARLDKKGLTVNQINIGEFGDVYFRLSHGEIRANMTNDIDDVWNSFISAIAIEPLKAEFSNLSSNFEYLDLRFGNKVFYKITEISNEQN